MTENVSTGEGKREQVQISELITCPECGHSNAVGTRYCDACGASLAGVEPGKPAREPQEKKRGFLARLFGAKR